MSTVTSNGTSDQNSANQTDLDASSTTIDEPHIEEEIAVYVLEEEGEENPTIDLIEEISPPALPSETVNLGQVAEWKTKGDYEKLEYHIRKGNIELVPRTDLEYLATIQQEHAYFTEGLRRFFQALQPMLEKQDEIGAYIDKDSELRLNIGKLAEEVLSLINPLGKRELPIIQLFKSCFDKQVFEGMSITPLESILQHQGIDLVPFLRLALEVGLIKPEDVPTPISTSNDDI